MTAFPAIFWIDEDFSSLVYYDEPRELAAGPACPFQKERSETPSDRSTVPTIHLATTA
jgi:hypothetical protein